MNNIEDTIFNSIKDGEIDYRNLESILKKKSIEFIKNNRYKTLDEYCNISKIVNYQPPFIDIEYFKNIFIKDRKSYDIYNLLDIVDDIYSSKDIFRIDSDLMRDIYNNILFNEYTIYEEIIEDYSLYNKIIYYPLNYLKKDEDGIIDRYIDNVIPKLLEKYNNEQFIKIISLLIHEVEFSNEQFLKIYNYIDNRDLYNDFTMMLSDNNTFIDKLLKDVLSNKNLDILEKLNLENKLYIDNQYYLYIKNIFKNINFINSKKYENNEKLYSITPKFINYLVRIKKGNNISNIDLFKYPEFLADDIQRIIENDKELVIDDNIIKLYREYKSFINRISDKYLSDKEKFEIMKSSKNHIDIIFDSGNHIKDDVMYMYYHFNKLNMILKDISIKIDRNNITI